MAKITLIGAGSVVFAKTLVCDLLQFPALADSTLCVMDIDPARLKVAELMVRKVIAKLGVPARVEATLDRRQAVRGAKYVICTIQVGGYKPGTVLDFEIPRRHGLLQTIGDTLGVGGVFRGLRTIPRLLEIARDIAEVGAPGCLFLNYTNPMAMLCMAIDRAVGVPTVGLCHSVQGTSQQLARQLGLPYSDITYRVAGINHMAFFLEFKYRGQDAYPLLFRLLRENGYQGEKVRFEMMRRLGYFVTESSEHQSEYNPHFIHFGEEMVKRFDVPIDEYLRRCEAILATWKGQEKALLGGGKDIDVPPQGHEYGAYIIHSRETNTPRVVYGNVPNTGLITNLPQRCCVELPVLVDAQGLQPTFIGDLPPQLAAICRSNINVQELTVQAALSGKREHIYHAVMADPHTAATLPLDRIWAMCDELIAAHQKAGLLGQYAPVIRDTGRSLSAGGSTPILGLRLLDSVPKAGKGTELELELELDNASGETLVEKVQFKVAGAQGVRLPKPVTLRAAAGKRVSSKVTLVVPPETGGFELVPQVRRNLLVLPFTYRPRVQMDCSEGPAKLELRAFGQALMEGSVSVEKAQLVLSGFVCDTDVKVRGELPWDGSCMEVFLARAGGEGIRQFFILPDARQPRLVAWKGETREVDGAVVTLKKDRTGYRFEARLPLPEGLLGDSSVLFDLVVRAGAVGEAHGEARVGLGGSLDSSRNTAHYTQLRLR